MGRLNALVQAFLGALFPRACVLCSQEGAVLCDSCEHKVHIPDWNVYLEHEGVRIFSRISYKHPAVQKLLHAWKYKGDSSAGTCWERWIAEGDDAPEVFIGAYFVPVPLAREAYAERGFNQAEVLAQALATRYGGEVYPILARTPRQAQAKTKKEQREGIRRDNPYTVNTRGAQEGKAGLLPRRVILVDDVCTTGNTVMACADALHGAGIEHVAVCTLAYGNPT